MNQKYSKRRSTKVQNERLPSKVSESTHATLLLAWFFVSLSWNLSESFSSEFFVATHSEPPNKNIQGKAIQRYGVM